jgi:hypothetical protein
VRALLSVANRQGLAGLARDLLALGVEVYATDGTREHLAADGIEVRPVTALTSVPPLLGGMVKTFHPAVYAGILARRDRPEQLAELAEHAIGLIDLVIVNVKPFAPQVSERRVPLDEAIEMIDVGGTALLAAAARNHAGVAAVPSPAAYEQVVAEIRARGSVSAELRQRFAAEAFAVVAAYHAEVAAYLNQVTGTTFPPHISVVLEKVTDLAHGENPHQRAAFYRETTHRDGFSFDVSYPCLLDLDAAWRIAADFALGRGLRHTTGRDRLGPPRRVLRRAGDGPGASFGSTSPSTGRRRGAARGRGGDLRALVATPTRPCGSSRRGPSWRSSQSPRTRRTASGTTGSPPSTSSGSAAASSWRRSTGPPSTGASCAS